MSLENPATGPSPSSSAKNAIAIGFVVLGAVLALLGALALFGYVLDAEEHRFGTEAGGLIFNSAYHYVVLNALLVALFVAAVVIKHWLGRISVILLELGLLVTIIVI